MEFLLTYGWAILAILAAIAALGYFTGFHAKVIPARCTLSPPFLCTEYKVTSDGTVLLGVQTTVSEIAYVNVTLLCGEDPAQPRSYEHTGLVTNQARLNGTLLRLGCPPANGQFRASMHLLYRNAGEDTTHESGGHLRVYVE